MRCNTQMRVLHVITSLHPDGAQRVLLRLLSGMRADGVDSAVLSLSDVVPLQPEFQAAGARVVVLGMNRALCVPRRLGQVKDLLGGFRPDVVQGWMYHGNFFASLFSSFKAAAGAVCWNIRTSVGSRSETRPSTRLMRYLNAKWSSHPECVIYCAQESLRQHEAIGFDPRRHEVLPNGFDTDTFRPSPTAGADLREALRLPADAVLVGNAGRYHPVKDHMTLLAAAALSIARNDRLHFVLAGADVEPSNEALREAVERKGLSKNVHLLGPRNDIPGLLSALDLYCSSSSLEGFPNSIAEAMSCGVPVVATNAGGSRELVDGGGAIVPVKDPRAMAEAVLALLSSERERRAVGESARRRIEERYSLQAMIRRYYNLYEDLLGG